MVITVITILSSPGDDESLQKVLEAEALAEVKALKGEAEAYAIEVKAKVRVAAVADDDVTDQAEAEQMAKKADAWKEYKEAAMVDMMMKILPKVEHHPTLENTFPLVRPSIHRCIPIFAVRSSFRLCAFVRLSVHHTFDPPA